MLDKNIKLDLEYWIRQEMGGRAQIGICAFSTNEGKFTTKSNTFSYARCVAIAALICKGTDPIQAASLVAHRIVYASPYYPGFDVESPEGADEVGQWNCGIYQLPDGALWAILADNDFGKIDGSSLGRDYAVLATRAGAIVDELPADRVRHLLTRCDSHGRYLDAA